MNTYHLNIQLMKQLGLGDLASANYLFAENVVWHYFNPNLPDVEVRESQSSPQLTASDKFHEVLPLT